MKALLQVNSWVEEIIPKPEVFEDEGDEDEVLNLYRFSCLLAVCFKTNLEHDGILAPTRFVTFIPASLQ